MCASGVHATRRFRREALVREATDASRRRLRQSPTRPQPEFADRRFSTTSAANSNTWGEGYRPSRAIALARAIGNSVRGPGYFDQCGLGSRSSPLPRSKASAKSWAPGFGDGYQALIASAAHLALFSVWHWLHALGVPSRTVRSGRGMRIEWSRRASTPM